MKHVFTGFSIASVLAFTILLSTMNSACKKGDTGPKGDTGTANVMYSSWLSVTFTGGSDSTFWEASITAPKLTKTILDSGMVKVYVNLGSSTNPLIVPLPIGDYYGAFGGIRTLGVYFGLTNGVGTIGMYCDGNVSTVTSGGVTSPLYRYIIIPGGKSTGRSAVNWNDYNAVTAALGIPK